jgi:hypothetical protein
MISKHDLAKALAAQAKVISTANSYNLIAEGKSYTPDVNAVYVEEMALYGNDNAIAMDDESSDYMIGIYQINIHTPRSSLSGKYDGLKIGEVFQTGFKRGTTLTYNNQKLRTKNSSLKPMDFSDTHFIHILSIVFDVIN